MTRVRWKRAQDGFVESHDGHWRIVPLYCGCTRPQLFELFRDDKAVATCSTQGEAKEDAERLVKAAEAAR